MKKQKEKQVREEPDRSSEPVTEEIPVEENGKLYSVMKCCYSGEKQTKETYFYFSGLVNSQEPSGKKYIEKQTNRAFKCMKALENIPE